MKLALARLIWLTGSIVYASAALGQPCNSTVEKHAVHIMGTDGVTFAQVAGDDSLYRVLDNGWVFALVRIENGWAIRLYEHERVGEAVDLTALTPPLRGAPNPRDIVGWHFRNSDNTAPNSGEVNAPQLLRAFVISPGLRGTAGPRPSSGVQEAGPEDGIGWLKIIDYGLANPTPGTPARMNFLKFEACLSWPRSEDEQSLLMDRASLDYTAEDAESFAGCGLDLQSMALEANYLPRALGGDIDGDGSLDQVAQVRRKNDGTRGIALCLAGSRIQLMGFDVTALANIAPEYVGQVEAWQWLGAGDKLPRHLAGIPLPEADGDILILERIEKEAVAVYWSDDMLQAKQLYRYVEP